MTRQAPPHDTPPAEWIWNAVVDGGELGCGELILELRLRFEPLASGSLVLVVARDEGAPIEVPSWCRMAGHRLEQIDHPHYLIRKRQDEEEP